ncbi:MAG: hypothetical protein JST75_13765 [Bacteroidetes bacterium]|nr:hypothetical protein [Bacteroidota bacterium]
MDQKNTNSEDQINISALKFFFISLAKSFFRFLSFLGIVLNRKKYFIIVGVAVGLAIGAFLFMSRPQYYQASMVLTFNKLTKRTYAEIVDQLNVLAKSGSFDKLSAELGVQTDIVSHILYFDSKNMSDEKLETDTSTKINEPFKIIFGLKNNSYGLSIQNALVKYLNNLPYIKKVIEVDRENNMERLKYIEGEIAKLDSLKTYYNRFFSTSKISATVYNNAVNPADIYVQTNVLVGEREESKRNLYADNEAVSLIDGVKVGNVPDSKSLTTLLAIMGGIGLGAAFLFALLIETRKYVMGK